MIERMKNEKIFLSTVFQHNPYTDYLQILIAYFGLDKKTFQINRKF